MSCSGMKMYFIYKVYINSRKPDLESILRIHSLLGGYIAFKHPRYSNSIDFFDIWEFGGLWCHTGSCRGLVRLIKGPKWANKE